jgi:NAD+ synthase (glutamine-hydrolysing)
MVTAYLYAPTLGTRTVGAVLGSANVDEGLRGYMTKYDRSSADLVKSGAISKRRQERCSCGAQRHSGTYWPEVASAPPTAELRPISRTNDGAMGILQLDEDEMGMSYTELGMFGTLRKISRCGPVSM